MMKEEKKPFELKEVEEAVGKEFFLVVTGEKSRKKTVERMEKYSEKNPWRRLKNTCYGLKNKITGNKPLQYKDIDGCLLEIVERKRGSVDSYYWGNSTNIVFEDGVSVGKDIDDVMEHYMFIPESSKLTKKNEIIMKGPVSLFNISDNEIGEPLEKKVSVYLSSAPKYKSSGTTLIC